MRRLAAPMLIVGLLVIAGLSAWPVTAQTSACQIAPVFLMLRDLIGKDRIGECTSAVLRSDSGDFNQPTTRGMLTFRPSDLIVAFSDGQTTWLYGPNGLESRPIGTRLSWEGRRADRRGRDWHRNRDRDRGGLAIPVRGRAGPAGTPPDADAGRHEHAADQG